MKKITVKKLLDLNPGDRIKFVTGHNGFVVLKDTYRKQLDVFDEVDDKLICITDIKRYINGESECPQYEITEIIAQDPTDERNENVFMDPTAHSTVLYVLQKIHLITLKYINSNQVDKALKLFNSTSHLLNMK